MFSNGFFAFHPFSHARDEFPFLGRGPGDLVDKWMEILEPWSTGALVNESSLLPRPSTRCCPHTCLLDRSQHAARQHFIVLPHLLSQPSRSNQQEEDREQQDKKEEVQQKSGEHQPVTATNTKGDTSADSGKAPDESPWQFSVDMSSCDEVRAMTDKGMLMVEGRGSSDTSQQMVRYITSLPRHVKHDSLTASLNNGRLTVTQKTGTQQLEGQARTLPMQIQEEQQQQAPEGMEQQQSASCEAKKQDQLGPAVEQRKSELQGVGKADI